MKEAGFETYSSFYVFLVENKKELAAPSTEASTDS